MNTNHIRTYSNTTAIMVKNMSGGSKHKGMARKAVNLSRHGGGALRRMQEEGELYAVVTKVLGGAMCHVIGMDKQERNCVIRGKFRGGKKRDNTIRAGVVVLIGEREWSSSTTTSKKHPICDLLEVYSDSDKDRLKTTENTVDWSFSNNMGQTYVSKDEDLDLEFTDNTVQEKYDKILREETTTTVSAMDFDCQEDVDIDDI